MQRFHKVHGTGNDFVIFDLRSDALPGDLSDLALRICDRRLGIGADGVLLLEGSPDPGCAVAMRIINADGSTAEMCGNGLRCLVKHVLDHERRDASTLTVLTGAGALACTASRNAVGTVDTVRIAMGRPRLAAEEVPFLGRGATVRFPLKLDGAPELAFTMLSMGNPHAVCFVDGGDPAALARQLGPAVERHPLYPHRVNAAFVRTEGTGFRAAVWERGAGLTAACGTGACAIGVAACLEGRARPGEVLAVALPGGTLHIEVEPDLRGVFLSGPAVEVFTGDLDLATLPSAASCLALQRVLG